MSPDQNKEVEIKARVTPLIKAAVHAIAKGRGEADSVIVREAVTDYLRDHEASGSQTAVPSGRRRNQEGRALSRAGQDVLLPVFDTIPAGWPDDRHVLQPERLVPVARRRFPFGAFGLVVTGNSMNAAAGRLGAISDGDTVILEPFARLEDALGKIVAALVDGQTTLKRLIRSPDGKYHLQPESNDPQCVGTIIPKSDLEIQGVVIGKLDV